MVEDGNLLYVKGVKKRIVITDKEKRKLMMKSVHEGIGEMLEAQSLGAHLGRDKTTEKLIEKYWWPSIWNEIEEYVRTCERCQKNSSKLSKVRFYQEFLFIQKKKKFKQTSMYK